MDARATTTMIDERGQLAALARAIGPEEPELGAAIGDPGETLRQSLVNPRRELFGQPTPFVGRRETLEQVYDAVRDAARGGRPGIVAIRGAPGLGKTRLVTEALSIIDPTARGIGVWPILADATDTDDSILAKIVRRRFGISTFERDQDAWDRIVGGIEPLLGTRLFGAMSRSLGFLAGLRASGPDALAPDLGSFRRQARRALVDFLRAELARAPQILVIGRSHRLTEPAARALRELLAECSDMPLIAFFLAENGDGGERPWPSGPAFENTLDVAMEPLDAREIERLVRALAAPADGGGASIPDIIIDDVVSCAAGSPGLAEANLRLLVQRGVLLATPAGLAFGKAPSMPLARDLEEAGRLRIAELDADSHRLLVAAAVIGNRFEHEAAVVVADALALAHAKDCGPGGESILRNCNDFGIVRAEPAQSGERLSASRFSHENDRLRLLDDLDEDDRKLSHAVAARWLQSATAHDVKADGAQWERIALHWIQAEQPAQAAVALREAALCARRGLSIDRARALFRKALIVLGLGGPGGEAALLAHAATALTVIESFAQMSNQTGDFQTAPPLFQAQLALARVTRQRAVSGQALFGLGFALRGLGQYLPSRRAIEAARSIFRDVNHADGLAGCLVQLARLDWLEGGPDQRADAVRRCDEALAIRRRLGAPRPLAETLVSLANFHIQRGDHDAARGLLEEARAHYSELNDLAGEARALLALGALAFYGRDNLQAVDIWRDALQLAERAGERELIAALLDNLGEALIETGDWERAASALNESRELSEDGGDPRILADVLKNLAVLHARTGNLEDAAEALESAAPIARNLAVPTLEAQLRRAEALVLMLQPPSGLARGQAERAKALFQGALETFRAHGDVVEQERTRQLLAEFATRLQ